MGNIALVGEGFRKRTGLAGDPAGITAWYGPTLRLSVADGSVAYGSVDAVANDTLGAAVVGYLPAFTLASTSRVLAQVRFPDGDAGTIFIGFSLGNDAETIGTNRGNSVVVPAGGDWHLLAAEFTLIEPLYSSYAAAAAAGDLFVFASHAPRAYEVSFLGFSQDMARPLRWRQRNDGLGGSSPRAARGVTSQQGSSRHRGYL